MTTPIPEEYEGKTIQVNTYRKRSACYRWIALDAAI